MRASVRAVRAAPLQLCHSHLQALYSVPAKRAVLPLRTQSPLQLAKDCRGTAHRCLPFAHRCDAICTHCVRALASVYTSKLAVMPPYQDLGEVFKARLTNGWVVSAVRAFWSSTMLPILHWRPEQAKNCDAAPSAALSDHTASDATEARIDNCSIVPHCVGGSHSS